MKKLKNKKGFTLVEVIVVLVILAILAALLVPSLTGYIDKANQKALMAETRMVVMAVQTVASEEYATQGSITPASYALDLATASGPVANDLRNLSEQSSGTISGLTFSGGSISTLTFAKGGESCTYTAATGAYTFGE